MYEITKKIADGWEKGKLLSPRMVEDAFKMTEAEVSSQIKFWLAKGYVRPLKTDSLAPKRYGVNKVFFIAVIAFLIGLVMGLSGNVNPI